MPRLTPISVSVLTLKLSQIFGKAVCWIYSYIDIRDLKQRPKAWFPVTGRRVFYWYDILCFTLILVKIWYRGWDLTLFMVIPPGIEPGLSA